MRSDEPPQPPLPPAALAALARRGKRAFLWHYARRFPLYWAVGLLALLATSAFGAWIPWTIRNAIQALQSEDPVALVPSIAGTLVLLALAQGLARVVSRTVVYFAAREVEYRIRNDLFAHLLRLGLPFYDRTPSGQILSRAANDTSDIRLALGSGFIQILNTVFMVGATLTMMLALSPKLTAWTAVLSPVLALVFRYLSRRNYRLSRKVQEGLSDLCSKVSENLTGLATVQAHGQEEREVREFEAMEAEYRDDNIRLAKYRAATWPLAGMVMGMSTVILIVVGGRMVLDGEIQLGDFVAFQGYVGMLQWPMIGFGWILNVLQRGASALDRLLRLLQVQPAVPQPAAPVSVPGELGAGLEIRGLSFAYPRAGLDDQLSEGEGEAPDEAAEEAPPATVLKDVNLTLRPGERVALVGKIGAGKSTLVDLLVRLYPVEDGVLSLGGVDLNHLDLRDLRASFGFVPQDRFLFSRTLRENLAMGAPQGSAEDLVERYAVMAQLDKDIQDFPDGYDTMLGERGVTLSGGQRQRACLTRALVREPRVMVLDDTFSAVDTDTEEEILTALRDHHRDGITLMITHRPSTMREADRIVVMDAGRVVEDGSHEELMNAGGAYRDLVETALLEEELGLHEEAVS